MRVAIIGTGYVGLVTGACLADIGHTVTCVDTNEATIALLQRGDIPFHEPGLQALVARGIASGALAFTARMREGVAQADVVFLCVGTPSAQNGSADLSSLDVAVRTMGNALSAHAVVATKSTVPVGTSHRVRRMLFASCQREVDVASNPEFLREGNAIHDVYHPERIVIGADTQRARNVLLDAYASFDCPKVLVPTRSAELIKYASNAFLATKISFINEMAILCEAVGADVADVANGMGLDKRIGENFLRAGLGYGGSCFPKDVRALCATAEAHDVNAQVLSAAMAVNERMRWWFYERMVAAMGTVSGKRIAVWGLSFKPNTDDTRESIALDLIARLQTDGASVVAYDPAACVRVRAMHPLFALADSATEAAQGADAILVATEWDEFCSADWATIASCMRGTHVFDGRNALNADAVRAAGLVYVGVGRRTPEGNTPIHLSAETVAVV